MKIVITVQITVVDSLELAQEIADEMRAAVDTLLRATDGVEHGEITATIE